MNAYAATTVAYTAGAWLRLESDPAPLYSDTPDATLSVPSGTIGDITFTLGTPKSVTSSVTYIAWFGRTTLSSNSVARKMSITDQPYTAVLGDIGAKPSAALYQGGGTTTTKTITGFYAPLKVGVAGGPPPWTSRIIPGLTRSQADGLYSATNHNHDSTYQKIDDTRLDATLSVATYPVNLVPYRMIVLTTSTNACQVQLQTPSPLPASGKAMTRRTFVLMTPVGVTPGAISWTNLTGSASIPTPAAGKLVSFDAQWLDATAGWIVLGVAS